MSNLLEIHNLKTHFRIGRGRMLRAVDGVSLNIEPGQVVGLVGESGSGKSTLGKTLLGLLPKTAGSVIYDGALLPDRYAAADFHRYAHRMAMIFQDPLASLNPRMTVAEIIAEPLRIAGVGSNAQRDDKVADWLQRVGMHADHRSRYAHELSGGQRQRIGIARALIGSPRFVVCDEALSALDVSVQAQIINLLAELQTSLGLTLLFIAHDLSLVQHIADRIAVMYLGTLVEEGAVQSIYAAPRHPYTQSLLAANPVPDPRVEKQRVHVPIRGDAPSPINSAQGCRFATRCPQVAPRCRSETPLPRKIEVGRMVACHLV